MTLVNLVAAYSDTGAYAQAQAVALQALPLVRRVGFRQPLLVNLVTLALRDGRLQLAAQLLGHLDAWLVEQGVQLPDDDAQSRDLALAALHEALGQPVVDRLAASGAGLSTEQADDLIAATPGPQSAF